MENRRIVRSQKVGKHELDGRAMQGEEAKAFAEGQRAAKEAFGKLRELLSKEKDKRR